MKLRTKFVSSIVACALVLAACGGDSVESGSESGGGDDASTTTIAANADYNATDVGFAQGMIPHHGQAVTMSDIALEKSSNPDVVALAKKVKAAQEPEIKQMTAWLEERDKTAPDPNAGMDMDMGEGSGLEGMAMSGMLTEDDMKRLESATGKDFDTLYLEFMIQHHEGAIEMANDETKDGKNADMKALANQVATSQTAEVAEIKAMLAKS